MSVPVETPATLLSRMDVLAAALEAAEFEYDKLLDDLTDVAQLRTLVSLCRARLAHRLTRARRMRR
jgi:hypothetical protein